MTPPKPDPTTPDWADQAVQRYRERLEKLRDKLGPNASIVDIEALLIQHENNLMSDTLDALTEGVSPPEGSTKTDS